MSGAALQNLAGSAEQERRAQRRAAGLPEIEPDGVRVTGWTQSGGNFLRAIPFFGHEDPNNYSGSPFASKADVSRFSEDDLRWKLKYNQGLLWKKWEKDHSSKLSYYEFCKAEMEKVNLYKFPSGKQPSMYGSHMERSSVLRLAFWMNENWRDLFFIQESGIVEIVIRVRPMIEQRVFNNPQIEMFFPDQPSSYLLFNRVKNNGFESETDEDYQTNIIYIMQNKVMQQPFHSSLIKPVKPGRVIVIKGVQDTTMNFRFDDYLEYHWVPEGVGEGFKP